MPSEDDLYKALDGQDVSVDDRRWRIHIFSIQRIDMRLWVQLEVHGDEPARLILNMAPDVDAACAMSAIHTWLTNVDRQDVPIIKIR